MTKKKTLLLAAVTVGGGLVVAAAAFALLYRVFVPRQSPLRPLEYGDAFTDLPLQADDGTKVSALPATDSYSLVFYLASDCRTCRETARSVERLRSVYGSEKLPVYIVWSDEIPRDAAKTYNLPAGINYTLNGQLALSDTTPTVFLLDKKQQVAFRDNEVKNAIKKIDALGIVPQEELQQNAYRYIRAHFFDAKATQPQILYFCMQGCPDCKAADPILDSSDITSKFDVTRLWCDTPSLDSSDKLVDTGNLIAKAVGVDWYPSFLIYENDVFRLVGQEETGSIREAILGS